MSSIHSRGPIPGGSLPPEEDEHASSGERPDSTHSQSSAASERPTSDSRASTPENEMQKRMAETYVDEGPDLQSVVDGYNAGASATSTIFEAAGQAAGTRPGKIGDLPNPHPPPSGSSEFPNLPNPHPLPGEHQAFSHGNPLAVPPSGGLGISSNDIEQAQKASSMIRLAGVAARARRQDNDPIPLPRGGLGFAPQNHPAFSPKEREQLGDVIRNDREWARSQTLGPTLSRLKAHKTEDPNEKEDSKFGMTDEEYDRRFAKD
jgi:hypothetical protein